MLLLFFNIRLNKGKNPAVRVRAELLDGAQSISTSAKTVPPSPPRPLIYVADAASASHGWSLMRSGELGWRGTARKTEREGQRKGGEGAGPEFESLREKEGEKEVSNPLLWDRSFSCLDSEVSAHRTFLDMKMSKTPLARFAAVTELR